MKGSPKVTGIGWLGVGLATHLSLDFVCDSCSFYVHCGHVVYGRVTLLSLGTEVRQAEG